MIPAIVGRQIRIIDCEVIAYGGAVSSSTATGVALSGTRSGAVVIFGINKAQLGQSVYNHFGTTSTVILADGASFSALDANTAVTFAAAGGTDLAGATGIDVILTYAVE